MVSGRPKAGWGEMSRGERRLAVVLGTLQLGLHAAALLDLRRRSSDEVRGPRWLWAATSFLSFIGPIAYFTVGRRRSTTR